MSEYSSLVSRLIHRPQSDLHCEKFPDKLAQILRYGAGIFGGPIDIPCVVVAGTKGKGSTCSVIESVLRESGLKTGLYTSPHLVTPRERIKINGRDLPEADYIAAYKELEALTRKSGLPEAPFFGMHTLMSAITFKSMNVDCAVVECGIGGRFDWTQIYMPSLSVITHLEFDHTEILGSTPYQISWHKAGICKPNVPALSAPQSSEFLVPLLEHVSNQGTSINIIEPYWKGEMGLKGPSALENTSLGVAAARKLVKMRFPKVKLQEERGAKNASIIGRYEEQWDKNGIRWLLDGAHTADSAQCCYEWYTNTSKDPSKDVLLCAATKMRDPSIILAPFRSCNFKETIYVSAYSKNRQFGNSVSVSSLKKGMELARSLKPNSILVTGSLHLVGDVMKHLQMEREGAE